MPTNTSKPLTAIQERAFSFIKERLEQGIGTTIDELKAYMGYKARSRAAELFRVFQRRGLIKRKRYSRKVKLQAQGAP